MQNHNNSITNNVLSVHSVLTAHPLPTKTVIGSQAAECCCFVGSLLKHLYDMQKMLGFMY